MTVPHLQSLGYWSWGIDPTKLVDPTWAFGERAKLVKYLRGGVKWRSYFGFSFCRFACGTPNVEMGSADLTDGEWVWPEGLWHYVDKHGVMLPDEFLARARTSGFVVPALDSNALLPDPADDEWIDPDALVNYDRWERWALSRRSSG